MGKSELRKWTPIPGPFLGTGHTEGHFASWNLRLPPLYPWILSLEIDLGHSVHVHIWWQSSDSKWEVFPIPRAIPSARVTLPHQGHSTARGTRSPGRVCHSNPCHTGWSLSRSMPGALLVGAAVQQEALFRWIPLVPPLGAPPVCRSSLNT